MSVVFMHLPIMVPLSGPLVPSAYPMLMPPPAWSWERPKTPRSVRGSIPNPPFLSPRKVVQEGWMQGSDPTFTFSPPPLHPTNKSPCRMRSAGKGFLGQPHRLLEVLQKCLEMAKPTLNHAHGFRAIPRSPQGNLNPDLSRIPAL